MRDQEDAGKEKRRKYQREYMARRYLDPEFRRRISERGKEKRQAAGKQKTPQAKLAQVRLWREKNSERVRAYREANRLKAKEYNKQWREANPEKMKCAVKNWSQANRAENRKARRSSDPQFMVTERLRSRLYAVLNRAKAVKDSSALALVGCDLARLIAHIESLFLTGMSWNNRHLWHIDHIRPCISFDLTDREQVKECFNYKNLQPLWSADNLKKGARSDARGR